MIKNLLIAAAIFAAAAPAMADDLPARPTPVVIEVAVGDLDLSRDADRGIMFSRIKTAMAKVCGQRPPARLIHRTNGFNVCKESLATTSSVAEVRTAFTRARKAM